MNSRPPGPPGQPGSPLETPVVWRAPGGLRGFVSRMGIGHVLEADVDGRKWHLDAAEGSSNAIFKLVIDGNEVMNVDAWPRAWVDTLGLRHLQRDRHDRTIDMRRPIDIAASTNGPTLGILDESALVVHDLDMRLARTVCLLNAEARAHSVAVDPAGTRIAAGFGHYVDDGVATGGWVDGTVRVYRVMDGAPEAQFAPETDRVHAVAFTADGDRVVSSCGPFVRVHRAWDQALETTLVRRNEDDVAFSPRGNTFVTIEGHEDIALWEVRDGGARRSVVLGEHPNPTALAFGMGGAILATANAEDLRIWDLRTLTLYDGFRRPAETTALAFTPRGDAILCAGWSDLDQYRRKPLLELIDARNGRTIVELHGHIDAPNAVCIDPRGQLAASASFEGPVRIWRLSDGVCIRTLDGKAFPPARLAFVNNGTELVLLSDQLTRWKVDDGTRIERIPTRSGAPYGGDVAKRKDGVRVGLARSGAYVEFPEKAVVPARNRGVLDISPDGLLVAKTIEGGDLVLTDTREGKELPLHAPSSTGASVLATSFDGIHYATGDAMAARVYRLGVTEPSAVYPCGRVTALAFGPNNWLAIGREDGLMEIRDVGNGTIVASLDFRAGHVRSLAFRGDGRVLAVATAREVKLIITNEWQEIASWDSRIVEDPLRVAWAMFRLVIAEKRGCLIFDYPDDRPPPRR